MDTRNGTRLSRALIMFTVQNRTANSPRVKNLIDFVILLIVPIVSVGINVLWIERFD